MAAHIKHVFETVKIDPKKEQLDILSCLVEKRDCIAILPTGYGKSLPYQVYPLVLKAMGVSDGKILVCSPLISLMRDQVLRANAFEGVSAAYIGQNQDIEIMKADIIFGSPESLLSSEWKDKSNELNVAAIVIDEFHLIATWGQNDKDGKQAFRKWFGEIGELRTIFPEASVLALSATCTLKAKKKSDESCNFQSQLFIDFHIT